MSATFPLRDILESTDEDSKLDLLDSAYAEARSGSLDVDAHVEELLDALRTERSEDTVSRLWLLLSLSSPNPAVLTLAEKALADGRAFGRDAAAEYVLRRYPDRRQQLMSLARDRDPAVAYFAGVAMLPDDPAAAVRLWLALLETNAPAGLAESLIETIGEHGDLALADTLLERDKAEGGGTVWGQIVGRIRHWHNVDYAERDRIEEGRSGYWLNCPACGRLLGVRSGHVGERARCRLCGTEFTIPQSPTEG